jgi:LacI family transcriptional regulator
VSASPTSHDVARLAGVSQPTVSRALRDDPRVAPETREAVRRAAERLRYVPSRRGRSLSTRRTGQIGVVVSDLGNPFYPEVLRVLHAVLAEAGRGMLVHTEQGALDERLLDGSVDGVVLTTTRLDSTLPRRLADRGFPVVLLNREAADAAADACVADNRAGARLVADRLAALGHRRIAAILGPPTTSTGRDREAGLRAGLAAHGLALPDALTRHAEFDFAQGRAAAAELSRHDPTAIVCANDVLALGALDALHAAGARVPDEMSVVGFDDIAMASWSAFDLTTVRQGIDAMVRRAAAMLLERVDDPGARPPRRVVLPAELVLRGTDGPPPA